MFIWYLFCAYIEEASIEAVACARRPYIPSTSIRLFVHIWNLWCCFCYTNEHVIDAAFSGNLYSLKQSLLVNYYYGRPTAMLMLAAGPPFCFYRCSIDRAGLRLWGALGPNILWGPITHIHRCTYGLKSGRAEWGTEGAENRDTAGVEGCGTGRGKEWGGVPPPSRLMGLGERRKLPQRGPGRSPGDLEIFFAF